MYHHGHRPAVGYRQSWRLTLYEGSSVDTSAKFPHAMTEYVHPISKSLPGDPHDRAQVSGFLRLNNLELNASQHCQETSSKPELKPKLAQLTIESLFPKFPSRLLPTEFTSDMIHSKRYRSIHACHDHAPRISGQQFIVQFELISGKASSVRFQRTRTVLVEACFPLKMVQHQTNAFFRGTKQEITVSGSSTA